MFTPNDFCKQLQARNPGARVTYLGQDKYSIRFSNGERVMFIMHINKLNHLPKITDVEEALDEINSALNVEMQLQLLTGSVNTFDFASLFDAVFSPTESAVTKEPEMEFKDLTDELYRVYEFPNGTTVQISQPTKLNVSESGGHRVLDANGISHYVPTGWNHLYWKVKAGKKPFSF